MVEIKMQTNNVGLEEIAGNLGSNGDDLEGCITHKDDDIYVHITRRKYTKKEQVVSYKRVVQKQLRAMTEEERRRFNELLKHSMTYFVEYKKRKLAELKKLRRDKNNLARLLSGLEGNGYSVIAVRVYHMPLPFDIEIPVMVTKINKNGSHSPIHKLYVAVNNIYYKKLLTYTRI